MKNLFVFAVLLATTLLIPSLALAQTPSPVNSQEQAQASLNQDSSPCSELLQHGIYDHFRSTYTHLSTSEISSQVCSTYSEYKRDVVNGKTKASYGLFGGSLSVSADQIRIIGEMTCESNLDKRFDDEDLIIVRSTISEAAMTAYRECLQLNSAGLKSNTIFRESDQAQVTLALRYVAPTGTQSNITIDRVVISPANAFSCAGTLWDLQGKPNALGTQEVAISCERTMATQLNPGAIVAGGATITVMTQVGTVNRNFTPIVVPIPPPPPPPSSNTNGPIYITSDGKVGIKTPKPTTDLHLQGDMLIGGQLRAMSSGQQAIIGETTSQSGGIGIYGRSTAGGSSYGMQGDTTSPNGGGVVGINLATSGKGFGLAGEARSPQATSLVLLNDGGGDLIRGLGKNGKVVFRVAADGSVWVNDKKVLF